MESLVAEYCQHELPFDETLMIACRQGRDHKVQNLMRRINYDISDGRAISVAAAAGHADVFKYLLDLCENAAMEGSKTSSYDVMANAATLLNLAATNGHEKVVDTIFNYCDGEEPLHINKKDERTGRTAFFSAVMSGHENIVHKLLARGAKLKAHGNTALHVAAEYGHQRILRILLESDDEGGDSGSEIETSISYRNWTKETYSQKLLCFFDTAGDIPLHKAVRNGHSAVVELILEHQPDLELRTTHRMTNKYEFVRSDKEYTPLHLAAKQGHLDAVKLLVANGANIEAEAPDGYWTALGLAMHEGHEAVVKLLLQNGANPL